MMGGLLVKQQNVETKILEFHLHFEHHASCLAGAPLTWTIINTC